MSSKPWTFGRASNERVRCLMGLERKWRCPHQLATTTRGLPNKRGWLECSNTCQHDVAPLLAHSCRTTGCTGRRGLAAIISRPCICTGKKHISLSTTISHSEFRQHHAPNTPSTSTKLSYLAYLSLSTPPSRDNYTPWLHEQQSSWFVCVLSIHDADEQDSPAGPGGK